MINFSLCMLRRLILKPSPTHLALCLGLLFSVKTYAAFEIEGQLKDSQGNVVTSSAQVWVNIVRSASESSCILYSELHSSVDPNDSGFFSLKVGSGAPVGSFSEVAFNRIFDNESNQTCRDSSGSSQSVYDPAPGGARELVLVVSTDGGNTSFEVGSMTVGSVPWATFADTASSADRLGKHSPTTVLRIEEADGRPSASNDGKLTPANFDELVKLLNGNSTQYAQLSSGKIDATKIPNLNASVINDGVFNAAQIPDLDAGKITSGTIDAARLPNFDVGRIDSGTLSVARGGTGSSAALNNKRVMVSSGGAIVEAAAIASDKALVSDANGIPTASTVTATQLGYLSGVNSSIQTQLDSKQPAGSCVTSFSDGDVTGTVSAGTANINIGNEKVTYAKMQKVTASNRILGRSTSGAGSIEEIAVGSGLLLSNGTLTASGVAAITDNSISYTQIQDISGSNRLVGRWSSGAGDPEEILVGQGLSLSSGTLAVANPLIINSTSNPATPAYSFFGDTNTGLTSTSADTVSIVTAGTEKIAVLGGGNVGIGVGLPSEKLEVDGVVKANGLFIPLSSSTTNAGCQKFGAMQMCWGTVSITGGAATVTFANNILFADNQYSVQLTAFATANPDLSTTGTIGLVTARNPGNFSARLVGNTGDDANGTVHYLAIGKAP